MSTTAAAHGPSPVAIFDMLTAYQKSFALKGAIDLDLFTAIHEGAHTASSIAQRCAATERGIRILCDYLVVGGLLSKSGVEYHLTQDSAVFLSRKSPAFLGGTAGFLMHPELARSYADIAATVRKGGTLLSEEGTVSDRNPIWIDFARGMGGMAAPAAEEIAKHVLRQTGPAPQKVLDIAAGHGMFGIAIAKEYRDARVIACDWGPVLEVAEENATHAGVADRFSKLEGDAMQIDFGSGYDVALLTNFLHHFDPATNETLLRKVRAALAPEGRVITVDFVPNADRVTPPMSAAFSLVMLASTRAGDAYTFAEFDSMFRNAGFARSELIQLQNSPQQLVVSYLG